MIFHANDSGRGYYLWPNISYLHKIMFLPPTIITLTLAAIYGYSYSC
ncbi:Uncharacterised protein [Legionella sainthelensi]|nr:Uncharacterised protein [Legionella sainthelensi]